MRIPTVSFALYCVLAVPSLSPAQSMRVEPGMWEFTSSMPDPLGGQPRNQTHRTCVRDSTITPDLVMARVDDCRIHSAAVQGRTAKWKMSCETPIGPMSGSGSLRSTDSAVAGSFQMTLAIGSLEIPANGTFKGRRLGACR